MGKLKLHWQIMIAIVLAIICGRLSGVDGALFGVTFHSVYAFIGSLFLNGLKMIIVPLVMSSIICGVLGLGNTADLGRMGAKTISFYLLSGLIAVCVGLLVVNVMQPGYIDGAPAGEQLAQFVDPAQLSEVSSKVQNRGVGDVVEVFLRMVPDNVVAAAAEGRMLGIIFFSMLFGYMITRIPQEQSILLSNFWQATFSVMMGITELVMKLAPIGVFGLVAKTMAETGLDIILSMGWFFITVVLALAIHVFLVLASALRTMARVSPVAFFKAMGPALLTAFSTSSSSATLPLTIECIEKNTGVSNRVSSFVLPLGATINMNGTALYECVAALFIAQVYGIELGWAQQFLVVIVALLTSIGVAGVPSASLVAISIILGSVGVPLEGIGLLMVTDRLLDMLRTSVNVLSDAVCAVVLARSEGETLALDHTPA